MSTPKKILYIVIIVFAVIGIASVIAYITGNASFSESFAQLTAYPNTPDKYFGCTNVQCSPGKKYNAEAGYCVKSESTRPIPSSPPPSSPSPLGPPGGQPGAPVPTAEICGDNIDNDGDGLVDEGCKFREPSWWKRWLR